MNLPTLKQNRSTCAACEKSQRPCAGPCACTVSGRDIREHQRAGECPLNLFPPPLPEGAELPKPKEGAAAGSPCGSKELWGPRLWMQLHKVALAGNLTPPWLAQFIGAIPCVQCRVDFQAWVDAHPAPWGGDVFAWTVEAHDAVSAKLDPPKAPMPVEQARERWGSTPGAGGVE